MVSRTTVSRTVVIGAGPASLVAAYKLIKNGEEVAVIDPAADLSRLSAVDCLSDCFAPDAQDFSFEIKDIKMLQEEILGRRPVGVPRTCRVFYRYRLFDYPLSVANTCKHLGPIDTVRAALSYVHVQSQLRANVAAENFDDLITERFGRYLSHIFFKPYAEKVWGMPAHKVPAEWAARSLPASFVPKAALGEPSGKSFDTAKLNQLPIGTGAFWEKCQQLIEAAGSTVEMNTRVLQIEHTGRRISHIVVQKGSAIALNSSDHFISNLPIAELVARLHPPAPPAVIKAAEDLKYRDLIIVLMTIERKDLFSDSSIYIHSPEFQVGRIQNYRNWHESTLPASSETTCLGMEYFCDQADALAQMTDTALIQLASQELAGLGLVTEAALIAESTVIRRKRAYPLYEAGYNHHLALLQNYLKGFENLQTVGCNGLHQQGTQADAMLTGLLAAKDIIASNRGLRAASPEPYVTNEIDDFNPSRRLS
ncbi:MAG: FAD-dependent oxidoreductase [Phormidesmis sp.]